MRLTLRILPAMALIATGLAGCASDNTRGEYHETSVLANSRKSPVDTAALERELTKIDDAWSAAAAARDIDRVASYYAEDAIAYPPNEPVAIGRDAARKVWAAYFAEPSFTISWKTLHADVAASGELGLTSGTYEASLNGPDGKRLVDKGKYLCTWRRQADGSWKAVHDMWNSDAK